MKLIHTSLDAMLAELKEWSVEVVRVSRTVHAEPERVSGGVPRFTSRIIVTAGLSKHLWAEWRFWVGKAPAGAGARGFVLPGTLRERGEQVETEVRGRIEARGFRIGDGLLAHDTASMDNFRL